MATPTWAEPTTTNKPTVRLKKEHNAVSDDHTAATCYFHVQLEKQHHDWILVLLVGLSSFPWRRGGDLRLAHRWWMARRRCCWMLMEAHKAYGWLKSKRYVRYVLRVDGRREGAASARQQFLCYCAVCKWFGWREGDRVWNASPGPRWVSQCGFNYPSWRYEFSGKQFSGPI